MQKIIGYMREMPLDEIVELPEIQEIYQTVVRAPPEEPRLHS